jgi:hypothetical protein
MLLVELKVEVNSNLSLDTIRSRLREAPAGIQKWRRKASFDRKTCAKTIQMGKRTSEQNIGRMAKDFRKDSCLPRSEWILIIVL